MSQSYSKLPSPNQKPKTFYPSPDTPTIKNANTDTTMTKTASKMRRIHSRHSALHISLVPRAAIENIKSA